MFDPETGTYVGSGSDGSEQISAVNCKLAPDGSKLCVAFHNNHMYMYTVSEESKTYEKKGRCSVSEVL